MRVRWRVSVLALILTAGVVSASPEAAAPVSSRPSQPVWRIAEFEHFEIHYLPDLAAEMERVGRAAERGRCFRHQLLLFRPSPGPALAMPANKKKDPRYAEIYRDMPGYAGI